MLDYLDVAKLEGLAALVDELVAAKNGLADLLGSTQYALLDRLIGRVHQSVSGLRMVPVAPFLRRYLHECLSVGYPESPLEQEAVVAAERLSRLSK